MIVEHHTCEILTPSRALIFNRVVGGGIFITPALVLALVGSKGIAIVLWVIGGVIQWAGLVFSVLMLEQWLKLSQVDDIS